MISWFEPFAPGLAVSRSPGSAGRSRDADLEVLVDAGIDHVVCLQEEHELDRMVPPEDVAIRREAVERAGMSFEHAPIEDFCAPSLELARELVERIDARLERGERVLVHCMAGLGRAGTIVACLLATRGLSAHDAIATTRFFRFGAIQSDAQEELIARFAASHEDDAG